MIEKYYEEEMRYLYESGKEFAKAHPDRARFLNIDAVGDRDPYVERLFEGFAFLAARVREKLDDGIPLFTEGLINLLWPRFLQTIPSTTIMQFRPRPGLLQETRTLPRGSEIISGPVGPESVVCRFTTTMDVALNPVTLRAVTPGATSRGNGTLVLRFDLDSRVSARNLDLSALRVYIHAERPTALMLYSYLCGRIIKAELSTNTGAVIALDPAKVCRASGFEPPQSLLPPDGRSHGATMLLLEYFAFPEKFLFVDMCGIDTLPPSDPQPSSFTFTFTFAQTFPENRPFSQETLRLFCAPAVNLFRTETEPVNHEGLTHEYRLIADTAKPQSSCVHSVNSVEGIDRVNGERCVYEPLATFSNMSGTQPRTFTTRYKQAFNGRRELVLTLGGSALSGTELHEESLSVNAWVSNGSLPRDEIRENGISRGGRGFPDFVMASNITRPSLPVDPPDAHDYPWIFYAHQSASYTSIADPDLLKSFLRLYNRTRDEGAQQRIDAISAVEARPGEQALPGGIRRGVVVTITVESRAFSDDGDAYLFGRMLHEFLSQYVSINAYCSLAIVLRPSGQTLTFSPREGTQWLI